MMGIAVPDLEQPILKNTNAILALSEKPTAILPEPTACIQCGRCIAPLSAEPDAVAISETAYKAGQHGAAGAS